MEKRKQQPNFVMLLRGNSRSVLVIIVVKFIPKAKKTYIKIGIVNSNNV